eukprot:724737-Hanusia_phi.AAC.2
MLLCILLSLLAIPQADNLSLSCHGGGMVSSGRQHQALLHLRLRGGDGGLGASPVSRVLVVLPRLTPRQPAGPMDRKESRSIVDSGVSLLACSECRSCEAVGAHLEERSSFSMVSREKEENGERTGQDRTGQDEKDKREMRLKGGNEVDSDEIGVATQWKPPEDANCEEETCASSSRGPCSAFDSYLLPSSCWVLCLGWRFSFSAQRSMRSGDATWVLCDGQCSPRDGSDCLSWILSWCLCPRIVSSSPSDSPPPPPLGLHGPSKKRLEEGTQPLLSRDLFSCVSYLQIDRTTSIFLSSPRPHLPSLILSQAGACQIRGDGLGRLSDSQGDGGEGEGGRQGKDEDRGRQAGKARG